MRVTSAASGSGDTNSRQSFAVTCCAVSGRASSRSSTASPSSGPLLPSTVFIPASCKRGRNTNEQRLPVEAPAGERARRLLHVLLGVVALAEREELHHLAREVLVRRALAVLRAVEIDEHRRVLGDRMQQRAEIAGGVRAERDVLPVHEARDAHLRLPGNEMVVPEERHALGQRRWRRQHLLHPPGAQRETFLPLRLHERLALCLSGGLAPREADRAPCRRRWRAAGSPRSCAFRASSFATAASRVSAAYARTSASVGPKPVRASRWRASS